MMLFNFKATDYVDIDGNIKPYEYSKPVKKPFSARDYIDAEGNIKPNRELKRQLK